MTKIHTEKAFEEYVTDTLLKESGWAKGSAAKYDVNNALFPEAIFQFIQSTQPALWEQMKTLHGTLLKEKLIAALVKELNIKGMLHILRHGFKFHGKTFRMAYFKPAHGLNPDVLKQYQQNQLTVTRQVPCHPNKNDTVDLVFSLNGLPVATSELKNPATGQTWRNAVQQYRMNRDQHAPLFAFKKRALVHFAVDPDEVHMTTQLSGDKTFFLPFNRGSHPGEIKCGAGNPPHPSGHRTGYFWEEVLSRDSFLDIIGHYMFIEKENRKIDDGKGGKKKITIEKMIFPRYHQIDSVRKMIRAASNEGAGHNYLIQHSAGSGKTNSISWLAHHLASLHNEQEQKIFDCVVVISDRRVLDDQLQDAIYQIEHAQGFVKPIDENSKQLAEALIDGTPIVITTLQKFPFVLNGLLHYAAGGNFEERNQAEKEEAIQQAKTWEDQIADRKYAVIVDEAHSSQSGDTSQELKAILGAGIEELKTEEEEISNEDTLNAVMATRGPQKNLSFFAFTATPKGKTIELFGTKGTDGQPHPFHTYSMRQAIEEGFILDVLKNYTNYKTYYHLVKAIEDNPKYPKKKAARALARYMSLHPHNIDQKTAIIIEHFRRNVKHRLNGRAKAMLVTSSRLSAIRYMNAFQKYINDNHYTDVRPLVAFSGKIKDPDTGGEYTEPGMNVDIVTGKPISEGQLPAKFDTDDYQILLVANKYQTGFDQPLLHTMYVDKQLAGVQAVQTLSRLNRNASGKDAPFVLDFVNAPDDIYLAFKPYYDTTSLQEETDPVKLEELKHELDQFQVYHGSEVEAFAKIFYKPLWKQNPTDHARLHMHITPAVDRFKALEEDELRKMFRDKLSAYIRMYSFLTQLMPYADPDLEKLYSYARFLLPHLPKEKDIVIIHPEEDVELRYYRLQRIYSGAIDLSEGETVEVKSPTDVGTGKSKDDDAPLSDIIQVLNEKFGTEFTEEDRLFFEQIKQKAVNNEEIIQTAEANPLDKFELGIKKLIESLIIQRMTENDKIVTRYMEDTDFQKVVFPALAKEIFKEIKGQRDAKIHK